jgi:stress response protein YsnF
MTTAVARGGVLLTVAAGERVSEARAVLRGDRVAVPPLRPVDPAPAAPASSEPAVAATSAQGPRQDLHEGDRVVPLREERLEIEKRPETTEARVRREVVTEQKTITVPVQREELVVERDGEAPLHIPVDDNGQKPER